MKEYYGKIQYRDKEYTLAFNLNVMEAIQDEYGSVTKWGALTDGTDREELDVKAVLFGVREMLNEGIEIDNEKYGRNDPPFTKKQVGRMLTEIGLEQAVNTVNDTVIQATKDESKNG